MSQLVTHEKDLNAVKILYSSLTLIAKVFYSLNYQVSGILFTWPGNDVNVCMLSNGYECYFLLLLL